MRVRELRGELFERGRRRKALWNFIKFLFGHWGNRVENTLARFQPLICRHRRGQQFLKTRSQGQKFPFCIYSGTDSYRLANQPPRPSRSSRPNSAAQLSNLYSTKHYTTFSSSAIDKTIKPSNAANSRISYSCRALPSSFIRRQRCQLVGKRFSLYIPHANFSVASEAAHLDIRAAAVPCDFSDVDIDFV